MNKGLFIIHYSLSITALFILLSSCTQSLCQRHCVASFTSIPSEGWKPGNVIELHRDTAHHVLVVRLDRQYSYTQLHLRVGHTDITLNADTIQGVGIYELSAPLATTDTLLRITHLMGDNIIKGVVEIGTTHD